MLNIPAKWPKEFVGDRRIPHQRAGPTKGVCFSVEDVRYRPGGAREAAIPFAGAHGRAASR